ncbi:DEAD/DEAH box helicase family protein [Staphylococcus intermedius]|uniref:ComF operon protein 1 n=1 Tax=Staphylococcus intermedius NCTC 11048 TaxID=1141106 RepID=A0A380GAW3_STAIN|nr:DEAD/DEAH box helicase family protein [Staphylococcus intermedius]PCF65449.1 DNA/RNA helicase [Staphylococcus intermedius]PCF81127.1 DNA/RNA helicase [Staphylococcus intermedius]PCF82409.1 DNA/RNA helicase [Staphylococcus intermedius]PCF87109.1 DNA/RNA helicase [Staphylococcus intermedius]PCF87668.1 DNA/RNA helicase [Staphylococcus intermedius]
MYLNGQLITDATPYDKSQIMQIEKGVTRTSTGWRCTRCATELHHHFYQFVSHIMNEKITYCRHCIQMGRMDSVTDVYTLKSMTCCSDAVYELPFQLSVQQQFASDHIVQAVLNHESLLLHAVTGAGKTEMMFEAIAQARRQGYNVAVVSPRLDVVIEVSTRIQQTFLNEAIDILHQASQQQYEAHFVISTVHQLYRFKRHFHVIFIDEVDAFPLAMDPSLMQSIENAARTKKALIYMTATPPTHLKAQFDDAHTITLPARFHQRPLVIPTFKYFKLRVDKVQFYLFTRMKAQQKQQRITLIFFSDIQEMKRFFETYVTLVDRLGFVYSEDPERLKKVEALRNGAYDIMLTTTILERGFTMAYLDVWVVDSHRYTSTALIQIAGRVGRKAICPDGEVLFLHEGRTRAMYDARHQIVEMNHLAMKRGWVT